MASLMPNGKQQFTSASGAPLVGGRLYTYAAGTVTPKATFSDAAGTVANTNPLVLDARGEALIYWSGAYKVVLQDASGNSLWTVDNYATDASLRQANIISVKDFGVKLDGVADDTAAVMAATGAGVPLYWPSGTCRTTSTILCTTEQQWTTGGKVTILYDAPAFTAAAPVLDFRAKVFLSGDFTVNHQANIKGFVPPTGYAGNVISGSAILVQGDYSTIENIQVMNAWDNGISVVQLNPATGLEVTGNPKYCRISGARTTRCGSGVHAGTTPGKLGAGVDVGSGSACVVSDCVDFQSAVGFILDLGAGAQATFSNCISWYALRDSANLYNGSGYGFFAGSGDSEFVNCMAVGSGFRGFWYDATANNCSFSNCTAYIPQYEGFWIKGGAATFNACRVKGASQVAVNTADAFWIDSSAAAIAEVLLIGCSTTGSRHRYGVQATGANGSKAQIIGGSMTGQTALLGSDLNASIGRIVWDAASGRKFGLNREAPGVEWDVYGKSRVSANTANASYITNPFGDADVNGTFFIEDATTPAKRLAMGYDPVNDVGVIQSMHAGTAKKVLMLNPSGGMVSAGQGNLTAAAADGFLQIPVINGAPTGIPNLLPGYVAIAYDTANHKLWIKEGAGWRSAAFA